MHCLFCREEDEKILAEENKLEKVGATSVYIYVYRP
jgi:hypothetical protein